MKVINIDEKNPLFFRMTHWIQILENIHLHIR